MTTIRVIILAAFLAGWSGPALALPLIGAAIAGAFFTGAAATIVGTIITVGLAVGLSYVASTFLGKGEQQQQQQDQSRDVGGIELDIRVDAEVPQQLLVGRAVTAGSLVYAATYGTRGEIDNSDLIEIIALADHPVTLLREVYIEGERAVLRDSGTDRGYLVDGYTGIIGGAQTAAEEFFEGISGSRVMLAGPALYGQMLEQNLLQQKADLLAIQFFDGTQTVADSYAVGTLSAREQPWTANHVGRGVAYARTHSIYDRELVPGRFRWKFVVDGIALYDPRKDSTVGGSGSHRWMQPATYEWTDNPVVIAYNILRGIYVEGEIFYGLEGTDASQLPLDVWFAAANECDVAVARGDGTTEKQYTCGAEISVDTEPLETIRALLKTCGGRLSEIGGVYKVYVGAPGLPVASITDGALLANREDSFKPVLGLEKRINYLTGTYTSPTDGWLPKVAPPREVEEWREEDGRRLPADLQAPMVQSWSQMQRLMLQMLQRARQQRKHTVPLGPGAFQIEPGDIIEWDSERNGYDDKLFEVDAVDYEPNLNVTLQVTEVDPDDYDWDTLFELPEADGRLVTLLPAAKVITGFDAEGIVFHGDLGTRRPAIRVTWTPPEDDDLVTVRWQLRVAADPTNFTSGSTDDVAAGSLIIADGGLQSLTNYQVRARFESFNGWGTEWSLWINVQTPDARIVAADFEESLWQILNGYRNELQRNTERVQAQLGKLLTELTSNTQLDKQQLKREIVRQVGQATAFFREEIDVAVGPESALAQQLVELGAAIENVEANLKARFVVGVTPTGAIAAYELQATAEEASAGFRLVAFDDGQGGAVSQIHMDADRFYIGKTGTAGFNPVFIVDTTVIPARIVLNADLIAPGSIKAGHVDVAVLSAFSADLGTVTAGVMRSQDGRMIIDLNNRQILIG